jgi:hypothetical protein
MKEKMKITGYGILNSTDNIIYDKETGQYCIDGQWEIPFPENDYDYQISIDNILLLIDELKSNLTNDNKSELIPYINDINSKLEKLKPLL